MHSWVSVGVDEPFVGDVGADQPGTRQTAASIELHKIRIACIDTYTLYTTLVPMGDVGVD